MRMVALLHLAEGHRLAWTRGTSPESAMATHHVISWGSLQMAEVGPMGNLNVCWVTARRMRTCMLPMAEGPQKAYMIYAF